MNGRCCSETADAQANHSPTRFQVWPFLLGSTKVCTQIKNKIHPESLNHPAKGIFGVSRSMLVALYVMFVQFIFPGAVRGPGQGIHNLVYERPLGFTERIDNRQSTILSPVYARELDN